ncbi:MAG: cysteine hydrolase family protein [Bacteroidota bacterium]
MALKDSNPALLVIDVQEGFDLENHWGGNRNNPDLEDKLGQLLNTWREMGLPVIHSKHDSTEPNSPLNPNHEGNKLKAFAVPQNGEPMFPKQVNSAFIGTGLEKYLKEKGIDTLVIVGLTTNHCISTTTRMAGNLGFKAFLLSDVTATFDRKGLNGEVFPAEEVHNISLASLHEEFATVLSKEELLKIL